MNLILSNFGHRFIVEQLKGCSPDELQNNSKSELLIKVLREKTVNVELNESYKDLIASGYLEIIEKPDIQAIEFKYKTNPLENVNRIVFEFTTLCNFNCAHCRNGSIDKTTETNINKLKSVADAFSLLNINRFDFIGGEVSKYGDGWLELAKHINIKRDKIVTVFTNGWWLEKVNFNAAGRNYANDAQYLEDLKSNGVTHILFSIDGDEAYHDNSRKHKGLYHKIVSSFDRIKRTGIKPRITALIIDQWNSETTHSFADIATRIYNLPDDLDIHSKINRLTHDPTNQFSNFIDIGSGVNLRKNKSKISNISSDLLRCKAFYRPSPSLRIMANGNLSVCPLLDAGEGYGNIHERNIVEILNDFQNSFAYKLHANKELKNYLKYLDRNIFGESYDHICSIRVILTLMARYIDSAETLNSETILEINRRIARYAGFEKT